MKKRNYRIIMLVCLMPVVFLLLSGCQEKDNSKANKASAVSDAIAGEAVDADGGRKITR